MTATPPFSGPPQGGISPAVLDAWKRVPDGVFLDLKLGKREIEALYISLWSMMEAQADLTQSFVEFSNSNFGNANESLNISRQRLEEARTRLSQFISALMYAIARDIP